MVYIYILKLKHHKYYVGKTDYPEFRLKDHFNHHGSEWTRKYKPLEVVEIIEGDEYDEDKYVIMYMQRYGIDNVRGGSFSQLELSEEINNLLARMFKGNSDRCFNCGKTGHFAKDCKAKKTTLKKTSKKTFKKSSTYRKKKYRPTCYKCHKKGHYANECKN